MPLATANVIFPPGCVSGFHLQGAFSSRVPSCILEQFFETLDNTERLLKYVFFSYLSETSGSVFIPWQSETCRGEGSFEGQDTHSTSGDRELESRDGLWPFRPSGVLASHAWRELSKPEKFCFKVPECERAMLSLTYHIKFAVSGWGRPFLDEAKLFKVWELFNDQEKMWQSVLARRIFFSTFLDMNNREKIHSTHLIFYFSP